MRFALPSGDHNWRNISLTLKAPISWTLELGTYNSCVRIEGRVDWSIYSTAVPALHLQLRFTPPLDGEGVLAKRNGPN